MIGSVRAKLLIPTMVTLVLSIGVSSYFSAREAKEEVRRGLLGMGTIATQSVSKSLDDLLGYMRGVASLESENEKFDSLMLPGGATGKVLEDAKLALQRIVDTSSFIEAVTIYDATGTCVTNNKGPTNVSIKDRAYFKKAMTGEVCISEPVLSRTNNEPVSVIAAPIKRDGKILGVLIVGLDLSKFSESMITPIRIGQEGYVYLMDGKGKMISHPEKKYIMKLDVSQFDWGREMLSKESGTVFYMFDGHQKVMTFKRLKAADWVVGAVVNDGDINRATDSITRSSVIFGAVGVALACVALLFVVNPILAALRNCVNFAGSVAAGDLGQTLLVHRNDELGKLGQSLSAMVDKLKGIIETATSKTAEAEEQTRLAHTATQQAEAARLAAENAKKEGMLAAAGQLEEVVSVISAASSQLSAQIEQSDHIASNSSQRLSEAATAMNEMNATVQEVASNASSASGMSDQTKGNAQNGQRIMQQSLQSIGTLHTVSLALKDDMTQLNEHAYAISRIMSVISDIADQTNLLALNAAIEAARAGDAGRGFAVVADEVRKLAEKTMASTHDVGDAISAIQASTAKSVKSMDNALAEVETATNFANMSGEALRQIVSDADATADQVRAIATASEQQSAASEEINQSILEVNTMAGQTAAAMGEAAKAVADMVSQAKNLSQLVAAMKSGQA